MSDIQRSYPIVYNYRDERLADLNEAIDIVEELNFSKLNKLTFEYPYWLIDSFGVIERDTDGEKIRNPKVDFLQNEAIVKFKDRYYVIKKDYDVRSLSRDLYLRIECEDMGYELTEKLVDYLDLTPPVNLPQGIQSALEEVLIAGQFVRENFIVDDFTGYFQLDADASDTDDYYNGYSIGQVGATGLKINETTITDYDATNKFAYVTNDAVLNNQDRYRIWNPIWKLGTIDPSFVGASRSHKFEFDTLYDSLKRVLEKYPNSEGRIGKLQFDISFNQSTGRWEKVINIVDTNPYVGAEFRYRENIKDVSREQDTGQIYTRIVPEGKDNLRINAIGTTNRTDSSVTYISHQAGYNHIDNFQYYLAQGYTYKECIDNFVKVYRLFDDVYVFASDLFNDAESLINTLSLPKVTYVTSVVDLEKIFDGKYNTFSIGDTIKVFDDEINLEIFATIERMTIPENEPWNSKVELSNFVDDISDLIQNITNDSRDYANQAALIGKSADIIIAKAGQSKNTGYADIVIPEGSLNCDTYIQNALDQLVANGGGELLLLEGEYEYDQEVRVDMLGVDGIIVRGQGVNTVIKPAFDESVDDALYFTNGSNVEITGINFQWNYSSTSINPLYPSSFNYFLWFNLVNGVNIHDNIISSANDSVIFTETCSNVQIHNNRFDCTNVDVSEIISTAFITEAYILIDNTENTRIHDNTFIDPLFTESVIDVFGFGSGTRLQKELSIYNNYIYVSKYYDNGGTFRLRFLDLFYAQDNMIVKDNKLIAVQETLTDFTITGIALNTVDGALVSNNYIDGFFNEGIDLNLNAQNNAIMNNTILTDANGYNARIRCLDDFNKIQGNTTRDGSKYVPVATTKTFNYSIDNNGDGCIISGNDLRNSGTFDDTGTGTLTLGGNAT